MKVNKSNYAVNADYAKNAEKSLETKSIVSDNSQIFYSAQDILELESRIAHLESIQEMILEFLDLQLNEVPARLELMKKPTEKKLASKAGVVKTSGSSGNPFANSE